MTRHERLVALLVERRGCEAGKGFARRLRWFVSAAELGDDYEFLCQRWPTPDAWRLDKESREVFVYEVEDTHPLPDHVLKQWAFLWHFLDAYDWTLHLVRVARWGQEDEVVMDACYGEFWLGGNTHEPAIATGDGL